MSVFITNVASMIGIGVAVDYSLFILARYREEIRAGAEPVDARRTAMRTSGVAVAFSGLTVIVSLAGLFLVDSTTIRSMALGAIVVVAVSILAAMTFLPALMRALGRRAYTRGRPATVVALIGRNLRWRQAPPRLDPPRGPAAPASGSAGPTASPAGPCSQPPPAPPCCWCSRSPRCRWSSATARCASSPRATRRASAPSWRRKELGPGASGPDPARGDLRRAARRPTRATAPRSRGWRRRRGAPIPRWRG